MNAKPKTFINKSIPENIFLLAVMIPIRKSANNFTLEHFEDNTMTFKIQANSIRWVDRDSVFRLSGYVKRSFSGDLEVYHRKK